MRRRIWTLGMAVMLSTLAACSGGGHKAAQPPPTPGPNPDVIPAVITPAYVNAVFRVLNHINGNAVRTLLISGQVTPQVTTYLRAIYNDPLYAEEVKIAGETLNADLKNVRRPPGDIATTVVLLMSSSPSCIFVETRSTYQAVLVKPGPSSASEYFRLSLKQPSDDPTHTNPTPWALSFNANFQSPTSVPDQCNAS